MWVRETLVSTKLNIVGHDKRFFLDHYDNSQKIFVYADVSYLIKLARNHILHRRFIVENNVINKGYFEVLLNMSTTLITFTHRLIV